MPGAERWAAIEDVGRLRDGLGVPVPPGTPDVFADPVEDPLADLVARHARTHGPFTADQLAERFGLGVAVVRHTLHRLAGQGRVLDGEFRPAGSGQEWCDAEVLRRLRRRSLARLRQEIEPVEPETMGRFLAAWQQVTTTSGRGGLRGVDGVLVAVEQLGGCAVPASALEPLVLGARVRDYEPSYLDELTASGEVLWAGHATLPGSDGWVSLHLADQAPLTLPEPAAFEHSELSQAVLDALAPGGAWFFRQLSDAVRSTDDGALSAALWDLVWAGPDQQRHPHPAPGADPRRATPPTAAAGHRRAAAGPTRTGPPETAGRWALLPTLDTDPTRRAHATAERLLERHGVVTRGAVVSERVPGGFAAVYKVLSAFEDSGRCRRGYFVEGLGAAQFGTAGAVDRLRTFAEPAPRGQARRRGAGRHRPRQPLRRRAALARRCPQGRPRRPRGEVLRPPSGPQGRRDGRPRRRRSHALRRARRPHPADLVRRPRRGCCRRPSRSRRRPDAGRWAG